jgi:hypothetical protein
VSSVPRGEQDDLLQWLHEHESAPAARVLEWLDQYESRENTVLGMCMARRPHEEIRDFLMSEPDGS